MTDYRIRLVHIKKSNSIRTRYRTSQAVRAFSALLGRLRARQGCVAMATGGHAALSAAATAENKHESDASRTCCGAEDTPLGRCGGVCAMTYIIIVSDFTPAL